MNVVGALRKPMARAMDTITDRGHGGTLASVKTTRQRLINEDYLTTSTEEERISDELTARANAAAERGRPGS